jgi:hypothetical protein
VQRQQSHNSPLIPRRTEYEQCVPTIQRQQRVSEQSPPSKKCMDGLAQHKNYSFSSGDNSYQTTKTNYDSSSPSSQQPVIINRPITLDLTKASNGSGGSGNMSLTATAAYLKQNDSIGLSTTSTNEDDFLPIVDESSQGNDTLL